MAHGPTVDLRRLRGARRGGLPRRGPRLQRRGGDPRAAAEADCRRRGDFGRRRGAAPARQLRRRQARHRGDGRRRGRGRHAHVARARGAAGAGRRRRARASGSPRRRARRWRPASAARRRGAEAVSIAAYVAGTIVGGVFPARRAAGALRARTVDINALMVIAAAGAIAIGEWREGATVVFLFALAQWLEARTLARARGAIRALLDLSPRDALVRRGGVEQRIPIDDGDRRRARHRAARRQDAGGRRGVGRAQRRERGADHRRVAAGRQGAGQPRSTPAPSTATARSRSP